MFKKRTKKGISSDLTISMQRLKIPIHNGTLKSLVWSSIRIITKENIVKLSDGIFNFIKRQYFHIFDEI